MAPLSITEAYLITIIMESMIFNMLNAKTKFFKNLVIDKLSLLLSRLIHEDHSLQYPSRENNSLNPHELKLSKDLTRVWSTFEYISQIVVFFVFAYYLE